LSTICLGIIDVVVVGIEGAADVKVEVDIGRFMKGKFIFLSPKLM
jgi:hypothetical protein